MLSQCVYNEPSSRVSAIINACIMYHIIRTSTRRLTALTEMLRSTSPSTGTCFRKDGMPACASSTSIDCCEHVRVQQATAGHTTNSKRTVALLADKRLCPDAHSGTQASRIPRMQGHLRTFGKQVLVEHGTAADHLAVLMQRRERPEAIEFA